MSQQTAYNHIEIIVGTFLVGTLAFIVANSWNKFAEGVLKKIEETEGVYKPGGDMLFYQGMYVIITTFIALLIMYSLIRLELVRHPGHP